MLLPNASIPSADDWEDQYQQALLDFVDKIELCINNSDWEMLTAVLDLRQRYLEQLFSGPIPDHCRDVAKQLAISIIEQDAVFQARVQELKDIAVQRQVSIERGRRALHAYTSAD